MFRINRRHRFDPLKRSLASVADVVGLGADVSWVAARRSAGSPTPNPNSRRTMKVGIEVSIHGRSTSPGNFTAKVIDFYSSGSFLGSLRFFSSSDATRTMETLFRRFESCISGWPRPPGIALGPVMEHPSSKIVRAALLSRRRLAFWLIWWLYFYKNPPGCGEPRTNCRFEFSYGVQDSLARRSRSKFDSNVHENFIRPKMHREWAAPFATFRSAPIIW
jgi:hypothetical protein